ncbi:unnamed protein product [Linum tenue]|uniref:Uncharacterized protein n=2 Tax=Linum TaxID=4005 RepID=A0AAV0NSN9_9ROSI|nr:unnamed protein product [Linum tenue]
MKLLLPTLLLTSMVVASSFLQLSLAYTPSPPVGGVCDSKCEARCKTAGYKERCVKYCNVCCTKCRTCVPSGTYGNKSECPCYRDMRDNRGRPKCP